MTGPHAEQQLHYIFSTKLAQFGLAIDRMEPGLLSDVFDPDICGEYGGVVRHTTRDEFIASLLEHLGPGSNCGRKQHNILNLIVLGQSAETALTRCNFYAVHQGVRRFEGQLWKTWGEYEDTWRLTETGWRIAYRRYTTYFTEGPDEINTRDQPA
ncbi:MAG TPA: nuclear transport factor 2 family protein [Pedomonas sp.]|uniref:nuclear transport factor 2 family protein n=1 Tax=Pedomonas sp. TaxID=2976421 RepID=UPI002F402004